MMELFVKIVNGLKVRVSFAFYFSSLRLARPIYL